VKRDGDSELTKRSMTKGVPLKPPCVHSYAVLVSHTPSRLASAAVVRPSRGQHPQRRVALGGVGTKP